MIPSLQNILVKLKAVVNLYIDAIFNRPILFLKFQSISSP